MAILPWEQGSLDLRRDYYDSQPAIAMTLYDVLKTQRQIGRKFKEDTAPYGFMISAIAKLTGDGGASLEQLLEQQLENTGRLIRHASSLNDVLEQRVDTLDTYAESIIDRSEVEHTTAREAEAAAEQGKIAYGAQRLTALQSSTSNPGHFSLRKEARRKYRDTKKWIKSNRKAERAKAFTEYEEPYVENTLEMFDEFSTNTSLLLQDASMLRNTLVQVYGGYLDVINSGQALRALGTTMRILGQNTRALHGHLEQSNSELARLVGQKFLPI